VTDADYQPTTHVYLDGRVVRREDAKVTVFDHGFLYGDGCFESIQATDRRLFMFDAHHDRLHRSLRALGIDFRISAEALARAIAETVEANELDDSFVKVVITRGHGGPPLLDPRGLTPTFVIFAERILHLVDPAAEAAGVTLKTAAIRRLPPWTVDAKIKSLNYLNPILARLEAISAGADDALLLDENGEVAEATAYNIFTVHGNRLRSPWTAAALEGITQLVVEMVGRELGLVVTRDRLTLADVYSADEVFLSSTAGGVIPVASIDGRHPLNGPLGPTNRSIVTALNKLLVDPEWTVDLRPYMSGSARHA
jgi:branched-chain amino acid aminotransferase